MYNLSTRVIICVMTILLLESCINEECLDLELIDNLTEEMILWRIDPLIESKEVTSTIGMDDLVILQRFESGPNDTIFDECDNASQSFVFTTDFVFQNFPIRITTELRKQGEEKGFEFIVRQRGRTAIYKFHDGSSTTAHRIELLNNKNINGIIYPKIFKIEFRDGNTDTEAREIYFAKENGIIQVTLFNGMVLELP